MAHAPKKMASPDKPMPVAFNVRKGVGRVGRARLFDYLVGTPEQGRGNRQVQCFGGLQIDDEFELRRLLDGEIPGFGAPQDLVDEDGRASPDLDKIRAIG